MMRYLLLIIALLAPLTPATARAEPGDELTIYLVTFGPGPVFYERFGHNALLIRHEGQGRDIAYNYGVFDFEQKNFVWNFIQGRMVYRLEAFDGRAMIELYAQDDRDVWLQELNLSPAQRIELRDFLEWNIRPENQEYRYDYYTDNCSTRVRDAIDRVVNGAIKAQSEVMPTGRTYRWHTRRLSAPDVPLYIALDYLLGPYIDQPLSRFEEMFLPVYLMEYARDVTIDDENGRKIPLVKRETALHAAHQSALPAGAPAWTWYYLSAGLLLGAIIALAGIFCRSRAAGWAATIIVIGWGLLAGVGGTLLTWAWFTDHRAAWWNENWFQLNLLCSGLVVLAPMHLLGRARAIARWWGIATAGLSLAGLAISTIGITDQVNGQVIALALPVNVAIAFTFWRRRHATTITTDIIATE